MLIIMYVEIIFMSVRPGALSNQMFGIWWKLFITFLDLTTREKHHDESEK